MINNSQAALIDLDSMDDIKDFANLVVTYDSDINIYRGSNMYDAKSILAIFALDTNVPRYVEIISDDQDEIASFKNDMKRFSVTDKEE